MDWGGNRAAGPGRIMTVGVWPCWDITCRVDGISWGEHARIDSQQCLPAGKSLNICRALAWLGEPSTAAGLWGRDDYDMMLASLAGDCELVDVCLTAAAGHTRRNITVVDTRNAREMHLRAPNKLATTESLRTVLKELQELVRPGMICVFSGALPQDDLLEEVLSMVRIARGRGARIVVDTSEKPLERLVEVGDIELIKPNLAELRQLLGFPVKDDVGDIVSAARSISAAGTVVVSRGPRGAIAVRGGEALSGAARENRPAVHTVGCGDWLLAGYLSACDGPLEEALERGLKVAAAKAWAWNESMTWAEAAAQIEVKIETVV